MAIDASIPLAGQFPDFGKTFRNALITGQSLREAYDTKDVRQQLLEQRAKIQEQVIGQKEQDENARKQAEVVATLKALRGIEDVDRRRELSGSFVRSLQERGVMGPEDNFDDDPLEDNVWMDATIAALEGNGKAFSGHTNIQRTNDGRAIGYSAESGEYEVIPMPDGVSILDSDPNQTSHEKNWETYRGLLKTDPEAAQEFGKAAGFVTAEGDELSVHMQKRLSESTDRAREARANNAEFSGLAAEIRASDLRGGIFGGTWKEKVKDITGTQDAVTRLRERYMGIRSSMAVKNLPPGVASDKDIELALKGFPTENANKETIASFLDGMAKLEALIDEYETFKAGYISENGHERNMLNEWRLKSQNDADSSGEYTSRNGVTFKVRK